MNILILCYEMPLPAVAGSHRVLYTLEHLAGRYGHAVTVAGFRLPGREYTDLSRYARVEAVELPYRPGWSSAGAAMTALRRGSGMLNVFSGFPPFLNYTYAPEMDGKVKALLEENRYDIIVADHPAMLRYALGKGLPVVLLEAFALSEITEWEYRSERNWLKKAARFIYHLQTRGYARLYKRVDLLVAVAARQREMVLAHDSALNCIVIPSGVDLEYFKATETETDWPCLVISGSMHGPRNVSAVLDFYREIYPRIKEQVPGVKLDIVGSNPDPAIRALAAEDETVNVTGYVPDLRSWLSRAWVIVAPLQEGFGMKIRVVQAMAMGKPIVSTPSVSDGIDVTPGENILVAASPQEFAARVTELLGDRALRQQLGAGARSLMESEYDWARLSDRLNEALEKTAACGKI